MSVAEIYVGSFMADDSRYCLPRYAARPRFSDHKSLSPRKRERETERQRGREGERERKRERERERAGERDEKERKRTPLVDNSDRARRLSPSAGCSNDPCGDYYSRDLLRDLFARKTRVCLLGNDLFVPLARMADFDDLVERLRVTVAITYGSRVRKTKDVSLSFPSNQSRDSNASR